ncbi:hypothetical protein [Streptomyces sp. NPDC046862]|uniref:hypothetical protein n=1 Tax=Streptomyces sp. NPDC046862 TaxID=3154603 RepID=UPI003453406D
MTPLVIVLIAGFALHTAVGFITRTPEDDPTSLHWQALHAFLIGLGTTAVCVAVAACYFLATAMRLPFWPLLLTADLITTGLKLRLHLIRQRQRNAVKAQFDRASLGEGV